MVTFFVQHLLLSFCSVKYDNFAVILKCQIRQPLLSFCSVKYDNLCCHFEVSNTTTFAVILKCQIRQPLLHFSVPNTGTLTFWVTTTWDRSWRSSPTGPRTHSCTSRGSWWEDWTSSRWVVFTGQLDLTGWSLLQSTLLYVSVQCGVYRQNWQ